VRGTLNVPKLIGEKGKTLGTLKLRKTTFETMLVTILLFLPTMIVAVKIEVAHAAKIKTITGVPAYTIRHGCAPTAVGMVVGYYDKYPEYQDLIPGDASTQTSDVNQAIASQSNDVTKPRHYEDYCLPIDAPGAIQKDNSELLPADKRHANDSIADFMGTSRSALGLHYQETSGSYIGPGFVDYVNWRNPSYAPCYKEYSWEYLAKNWQMDNPLIYQIDHDRPMVFAIDPDGTGKPTDADAVTVIGYDLDHYRWPDPLKYACLRTQNPTEIKWYAFDGAYIGRPGGVWWAWAFALKPKNPIGDSFPQEKLSKMHLYDDDGDGQSEGSVDSAYRVSFDAQNKIVRVVLNIALSTLNGYGEFKLADSYPVVSKLPSTDPKYVTSVTGYTLRNQWKQGIEGIWSNRFYIVDGDYKYTIEVEVNWFNWLQQKSADWTVDVKKSPPAGTCMTDVWYTQTLTYFYEDEGRVKAHEAGHMMGLYDEGNWPGAAYNGFTDPDGTSIMGSNLGVAKERHYADILEWLMDKTGRINMIVASNPLAPPPPGEPVSGFHDPIGYSPVADAGGPYVVEEGYPMSFDATGSYDRDGTIVSYEWDFGDGSTASGSPTPTHTYEDRGVYTSILTVTDDDGLIRRATASVTAVDTTPPSVAMVNPPSGYALQDGVTFIATATDIGSGVNSVTFSIREDSGGDGVPVGFEDIPGIHEPGTDNWKLWFDTQQLPDGYYVVVAKATDNAGNVGSIKVPYSIRNWAIIELLPSSAKNKAGRTMPVKFSLRVAAAVDPTQPFVYNEELTIKIYASSNPSNILQTSTYGNGARNYRVDAIGEKYITNFKTLNTPKQYTVSVNRNTFLIGSFNFQTVA